MERDPGPSEVGTGLYLPGNWARALDRLGVLGAVLDRAAVIEVQRILDHRGRVLAEIDLPRCGAAGALSGVLNVEAVFRAGTEVASPTRRERS